MKPIKFSLILLIAFCIACKSDTSAVLDTASKSNLSESAKKELIHCVYFDLIPDLTEASMDTFMNILRGFSEIESTNEVIIGKMEDTGDPRMDPKYDVALQVYFDSKEKLDEYQVDSIHLSGKEELGAYLAGPPAVFDYWNQY